MSLLLSKAISELWSLNCSLWSRAGSRAGRAWPHSGPDERGCVCSHNDATEGINICSPLIMDARQLGQLQAALACASDPAS